MLKSENKLIEEAKDVFVDSSTRYTTTGKRHLGESIGSTDFRQEYAAEEVNQWFNEIKKLADIAITEPNLIR